MLLFNADSCARPPPPPPPSSSSFFLLQTIKTSTAGTLNMLGLASRVKAKILFASTSEVYGDPRVHPQPETYWGNVNPIGPRACYDEGKRVGETLMYAYERVRTRFSAVSSFPFLPPSLCTLCAEPPSSHQFISDSRSPTLAKKQIYV